MDPGILAQAIMLYRHACHPPAEFRRYITLHSSQADGVSTSVISQSCSAECVQIAGTQTQDRGSNQLVRIATSQAGMITKARDRESLASGTSDDHCSSKRTETMTVARASWSAEVSFSFLWLMLFCSSSYT